MSDPALGLTMLGLIVVAIMMGFPTAFTLMGLGMIFGYLAFWVPDEPWYANRIFDLIVQRTYGVMTNDTLLSVPLFVFMGYIMERAALVDRMFHSVQLAFRRVPASLAVTTLLVCAFSGHRFRYRWRRRGPHGCHRDATDAERRLQREARLRSDHGRRDPRHPDSTIGHADRLCGGGGTVDRKVYAAAMLPGFFLTFLYLVYILGWAIINPKIAPKLPPDQYRVAVPDWLKRLESEQARRGAPGSSPPCSDPDSAGRDDTRWPSGQLRPHSQQHAHADGPSSAHSRYVGASWWYVLIYNAPAERTASISALRCCSSADWYRDPRHPRLLSGSRRSSVRRSPRCGTEPPEAQTRRPRR